LGRFLHGSQQAHNRSRTGYVQSTQRDGKMQKRTCTELTWATDR